MKTQFNALVSRVDTRLAACAAAASASLAVSPISNATIIYSGIVNINIPSTSSGIYLNVITGVFSPNPASVPGWDINPWSASNLEFFTPTPNPGGGGEMVGSGTNFFNLGLATLISGASTFTTAGITTPSAAFPLNLNSSNNYLGFRFTNEVTGIINYGWAQIALSGTVGSQPRMIVSYAYEDSGVGIFTPLPEPSSLCAKIYPPLCFTIPYTVDKPRPVPLPFSLVVKNGSKMRD